MLTLCLYRLGGKLHKNQSSQKGLTFIEVLIALVILVTGILGAVAMQASAKKGSFDAMQRSVASALAQDIINRMRVNNSTNLDDYEGTAFGTGVVKEADVTKCITSLVMCTSAQLAVRDLYLWEQALMGADVKNGTVNVGGLSGAVGCIDHDAVTVNGVTSNNISIIISWQGRTEIADGAIDADKKCGATGTDKTRRQIVMETQII